MPVPKAVLEQAARAEELQKKLAEPKAQAEPPHQPPAPTPAPAAATPPQEPPKNPDEDPNSESWKQRFTTLTGKYNAEVPRLAAQLRDAFAEIKQLRADLEAAKTAKPPESLLRPEEIQEFGEPLIDVTRRVAKEVVAEKDVEIADLKRRLDRQEVSNAATIETRFYEDLAKAAPDWPAINDDERFHAWLREPDPYAGVQRQVLLSDAEDKRDAARVATFFNAFKGKLAEQATTARTKLEEQIAPESGSPSSAPPAKRIWTRKEIARFYSDWRSNRIPSDKAVEIEAEIQRATLEGRIR